MEEILLARQSSGPASGVIGDTDARMVGVDTDVVMGIVAASIARRISCARAAFVEEILLARQSSGPVSISDTDARMVGVNTDVDIGFVTAIARATFIARDCVKNI